MLQPFQITVEIFVRADCQKFDSIYVKNAIREKTQLIGHAKFINTNSRKITHFFFTNS